MKKISLTILFLLFSTFCYAITIGSATVDIQTNQTSPHTFNHTCEAGSDAIIIITQVNDTGTIDMTAVSYDGNAAVEDEEILNTSFDTHLSIWRDEEPTTTSSVVVSVTWTGGTLTDLVTTAVCIAGADTGFAIDASTAPTSNTGSGPMAITVTTVADDTISFGVHFDAQNTLGNISLSAGPTSFNITDIGTDVVSSAYRILTAQGASTFSWVDSDDDEEWQDIAISYAEAVAAVVTPVKGAVMVVGQLDKDKKEDINPDAKIEYTQVKLLSLP